MKTTLEHVNVTVTDADATAELLCNLFGWKVRWAGPVLNGAGRSVHVGDDAQYIALYGPKKAPEQSPNSYAHRSGLNHIGLVVDDFGCSRTTPLHAARGAVMAEIILYNTKTRRKERFDPIDPNNVRMYVCGPTVYDRAHIGNARPVLVFDVLFRLLRHVYGPDHVTYVRNFTDVDDKINARAAQSGTVDFGYHCRNHTMVFR
ncbi:Cysteine--tRNA ligase [Nymphon striatum]|nr:Cysteine--tRNA ligase [Nymphon striatum]